MIYNKNFAYEILEYKSEYKDTIVYFFMAEKIDMSPISGVKIIMIYPYNWNLSMTPWKYAGKGMEETGGGDDFIEAFMELYDKKYTRQIIGGYSLGGLMALYMGYKLNRFDAVISASGSMWYTGALDYFTGEKSNDRTKSFYFSIGNKEHFTKNSERARVLDNTKAIAERLDGEHRVCFEINNGGHFTDIKERIIKSIKYFVE